MESQPPPQPLPLDYGGLADRHAYAVKRRYRRLAVVGLLWSAAMLVFYIGLALFAQDHWEGELPFAIVIAGAGVLPALFLLAGCFGTFLPAPWVRMAMLFGGYGAVGGSIIQMMGYLAAASLFGQFLAIGVGTVVVQLCVATAFLYAFHDEIAVEFYGG